MYHCTFCAHPADTPSDQCTNCFHVKPLIRIYDATSGCPICFEKTDIKPVFNCGHHTCFKCFYRNRLHICPICSQPIVRDIRCTSVKINLDIKPEIKPEFAVLCKRIVKSNAVRVIGHDELLRLLNEYYKWLVLQADVDDKLIPARDIEKIWRLHILDTVSYATVCKAIGAIIDYDVETRTEAERINIFKRTLTHYEKKFGPMSASTRDYWFIDTYRADLQATNRLFIKTLTGKRFGIPFRADMTLSDIKQLILMCEGIPQCQQIINYKGDELPEGSIINSDIVGGTTLYLCLKLKGC